MQYVALISMHRCLIQYELQVHMSRDVGAVKPETRTHDKDNPPSTTPHIDATNCATETSQKKDVQEALIVTTTDVVHVVYWFLFNGWHLFSSQIQA